MDPKLAQLWEGKRVILGSGSPRRQELLGSICPSFEVVVSGANEDNPMASDPALIALELAERKLSALSSMLENDLQDRLIICADTVVSKGQKLYGKPADLNEAVAILSELSGSTHIVTTGVAIGYQGSHGKTSAGGFCQSQVRFRELSQAEISDYVSAEKPLDKAGAYAIQEGAARFVESVEGPMDNIVGLPLGLVVSLVESVLS